MAGRKLTPEQVEEIKSLKEQMEAKGEQFIYSQVAKKYGVTGQTIRRNISPSENDKKPRPAAKYDPIVAKKRRESTRAYQFYAYQNIESDRLIIEKLDGMDNKQQYIKGVILQDILSKDNPN